MLPATPTEGSSLGALMRQLAHDVHELTARGGGLPGDLVRLSRRLQLARDRIRHLPPSALHRWLDCLEQEIRGLVIGENN